MSTATGFSITRKIEIDTAHRVPDHASKCRNLHGHRYVIEATCVGSTIESGSQRGMVMDFSFLKEYMHDAIYEPCDHGTIFYRHDPMLKKLCGDAEVAVEDICSNTAFTEIDGWKIYVMDDVPTAENLAKLWYSKLSDNVKSFGIVSHTAEMPRISSVNVWETPNCVATYPIATATMVEES